MKVVRQSRFNRQKRQKTSKNANKRKKTLKTINVRLAIKIIEKGGGKAKELPTNCFCCSHYLQHFARHLYLPA
jgi:hypothetical protein